MPASKIRFIFECVITGIILILLALLKGHVTVVTDSFQKEFSLCFLAPILFIGVILWVSVYHIWYLAWNLPHSLRSYLTRRRSMHTQALVVESVFKTECDEYDQAQTLLQKATQYHLNNDVQILAEVINAMLSKQHADLGTFERSALKLKNAVETHSLGVMYYAECTRQQGRHEEALKRLFELYQSSEKDIRVKEILANKLFLELMILAQEKDIYAQKSEDVQNIIRILSKEQISLLLSYQAIYREKHQYPLVEIETLYQHAFKFNERNIDAICYLVKHGQYHDRKLRALLGAFEHQPHPMLIKTLMAYNCGLSNLEKFQAIQKIGEKQPQSLELLYCLAIAALSSGLIGEASHYTEELVKRFTPMTNKRVIQLQMEIEKNKENSYVNMANLVDQALKEAKDDLFRCEVCLTDCHRWKPYCEHCGKINTLAWVES